MAIDPGRGDVWLADLNPVRGHEQAGRRPVLVISEDVLNRSPAGLVIVLPITSTQRGIRSHVPLTPPEGGLRGPSVILCEAVRCVDKSRLTDRWGAVSPTTLAQVEDLLRILVGL
jgi:mRNA interferase MazF